MSEIEFDRIVDAVRKEIAHAPVLNSLTGLRASDWRAKAAGDKLDVPPPRSHGQDSPRGRGAEAIQVKRYRVS